MNNTLKEVHVCRICQTRIDCPKCRSTIYVTIDFRRTCILIRILLGTRTRPGTYVHFDTTTNMSLFTIATTMHAALFCSSSNNASFDCQCRVTTDITFFSTTIDILDDTAAINLHRRITIDSSLITTTKHTAHRTRLNIDGCCFSGFWLVATTKHTSNDIAVHDTSYDRIAFDGQISLGYLTKSWQICICIEIMIR